MPNRRRFIKQSSSGILGISLFPQVSVAKQDDIKIANKPEKNQANEFKKQKIKYKENFIKSNQN